MSTAQTSTSSTPDTLPGILDGLTAADVSLDPFPHLAIRDRLDAKTYATLEAAFPPLDIFLSPDTSEDLNKPSGGGADSEMPNNAFRYITSKEVRSPAVAAKIDPLWQDWIAQHTTNAFYQKFLDLFEDHIRANSPYIEERFGPLREMRIGTRYVEDYDQADVLLDSMLYLNTPVTDPTSVRGIHIDKPIKFFTGLFYMRHPEDDSQGGALELFRYKEGRPAGLKGYDVLPEYVECVRRVEYDRNVLVLFPDYIHALHGVQVRQPTKWPRRYLGFVADFAQEQYDISAYQVD